MQRIIIRIQQEIKGKELNLIYSRKGAQTPILCSQSCQRDSMTTTSVTPHWGIWWYSSAILPGTTFHSTLLWPPNCWKHPDIEHHLPLLNLSLSPFLLPSLFFTHTHTFLLAFSLRRRLKGPKTKRGLPSSMDGVLYLQSNLFRWLVIIFNLRNGNLGFKRLISFLGFLPLLNIGSSYELRESEKYPEQILLTTLFCLALGRHMIV